MASKSVSVNLLKKLLAALAAVTSPSATDIITGANAVPSASPASPTAFFILSNCPAIVSPAALATPPNWVSNSSKIIFCADATSFTSTKSLTCCSCCSDN